MADILGRGDLFDLDFVGFIHDFKGVPEMTWIVVAFLVGGGVGYLLGINSMARNFGEPPARSTNVLEIPRPKTHSIHDRPKEGAKEYLEYLFTKLGKGRLVLAGFLIVAWLFWAASMIRAVIR